MTEELTKKVFEHLTCPVEIARECDSAFITNYCTSKQPELCQRYKEIQDRLRKYGGCRE